MAHKSDEWNRLKEFLILDELIQLDGRAGWLSIEVLHRPLVDKDVDRILEALEQLKKQEPIAGMSDREAITLLNMVKGTAEALIKTIHEVLPRTAN